MTLSSIILENIQRKKKNIVSLLISAFPDYVQEKIYLSKKREKYNHTVLNKHMSLKDNYKYYDVVVW